MRNTKFLWMATLIVLVSSECWADLFTVTGETKNWIHSQGSDLNYLIGIENPSSSSEPLLAWSLNLTVHPHSAETTGSLIMANAYTPSQNYLFEGRSTEINPPFVGPRTSVKLISDMDSEFTGVVVPKSGMYLLELDLQASNDAQGLFDIDVQPQDISSYWASLDDLLEDPPKCRSFDNLPFNSASPVTIGTVMIQKVPEPSSLVILSAGIAFCVCYRLRSARKTKNVFPRGTGSHK